MIASVSSPLTNAPITPKLVTLRFSKALDLFDVFKYGYRNRGKWAFKKYDLVYWCNAKHYNNPKTLHILDDWFGFKLGGDRQVYICAISYKLLFIFINYL